MRRHFARTAVVLVFSVIISGSDLPKGPQVLAGSADQVAAVAWAVDRFELAGLIAPAVTIGFHPTRQGCDGHPGLFRDRPRPRIDLCEIDPWSTAGRKTLLHEMSHAWAYLYLDAEEIEDFRLLRGLTVWAGEQARWEYQGSEHAAEILSWALFDRELDLVTIPNADRASITAAYFALTGMGLPGR